MYMQVTLRRKNDSVHFEGQNQAGHVVQIDGPESIGGVDAGMRPMELLLISMASCACLDIAHILKKQRQTAEDISVSITGERHQVDSVKPFKSIHLAFSFKGELTSKKVEQALELSIYKYCSVAASLDKNIKISYDYSLIASDDE